VFKRTGGLPVPYFMTSQGILGSVGIVHFSMGAGGYCFMFYSVYVHSTLYLFIICIILLV